jgi:acetyl-CoA carboxylase carboxyl transferase subunit beta
MFDGETWLDIAVPETPVDPLKFRDQRRYADRLKDARTKTGMNDAIKLGFGKLEGLPVVIGVQDFDFMGGSLGMAAGEAVVKGLQMAAERGTPYIMFAASGGARMQEGILSLMQMPRTTVAVEMLREAGKPYIVVLTNPTTGGVTASYAMLGDVHIAEPGALIGFAGPRVIEQTIREKLPSGFQRSEYLKEHGMVDMVVHRHELRRTLANLCRILTRAPASPAAEMPALLSSGACAMLKRGAFCRHDTARRDPAAAPVAASQADRPVARANAAHSGAARSSRAQIAAGDPCRGHQRQGLDHRLHARHAGGGRFRRSCLYLAASGAL